ncbi:predicted protein [Botrytis cinerea T4]|uniref:Uncharacterized protein n=1 Tax=Botryotinia fuckeliana (strain T4) TaxID=999810 RepID=G2YCU1_BOTF4|nr:predicted protein [Botrytis cinerea T4]
MPRMVTEAVKAFISYHFRTAGSRINPATNIGRVYEFFGDVWHK